MAEEFEGRDLRGAVFWGVDLAGARFRDVDLSGVRISHARVVDVDIDAFVDRVTINGVDVTDFVNEHDAWYPLRSMLTPADAPSMRTTLDALEDVWAPTIERARHLGEEHRRASVGGEWSFVETLRHLVFAIDKWFSVPILGDGDFHPIGISNSGSVDFGWPGLDRSAEPGFEEVLAVRADRLARLRTYLDGVDAGELDREVDVLENGTTPIRECVWVVFEEEFQHHRYAVRDLATFG